MIARGFKSVIWVGAVGSAALGCYMVSLRVATERADLVKVEHQIVEAKRDIRSLQTELGTRGRLTQLEDWNANVLALAAPTPNQFVKDGFALARLQTQAPTVEERTGEVRMAALETGAAASDAKPQEAASAAAKPAAAPASPKPDVAAPEPATPRMVRAVAAAPAPRAVSLVRRASFVTGASAEPVALPKHDAVRSAAANPPQPGAAAAARPADSRPAPAKTVKPAATTAANGPRPALRSAAADKPQAAKPPKSARSVHAPTKLAGADAAAHAAVSGHHGGAQ